MQWCEFLIYVKKFLAMYISSDGAFRGMGELLLASIFISHVYSLDAICERRRVLYCTWLM